MNIAANTKISALIKANPAAVEAIASINKHFEKLRNPLLRKLLASRVTIADAARIGGCDVQVFFERLAPLGFVINQVPDAADLPNSREIKPMPAFLAQLPENSIRTLDVREDISTGNDPFLKIMDGIDKVREAGALLLINTFEPTPLFSILEKKGFAHYTVTKGQDLVHTYFWLEREGEKATETTSADKDFKSIVNTYGNKLKHMDVRHLEMPQPMVTILQALEQLGPDEALYVTHRRVPQFLVPQLQERGFAMAVEEAETDKVYLVIYRETLP